MPFTLMKPDSSNVPALFGLLRVRLKDFNPGTFLINKFTKLTLYKDWGVKWVASTPRRKLVFLEHGPLDDHKINAYCIGQYAKDFSAASVGDIVFVANATIQKSATFSRDTIHPCQLVFSSESKPDIWVIPSSKVSSSATVDNTSARQTTQTTTTTGVAVPFRATSNDSAVNLDQTSDIFKHLYQYRYTPLKDVKVTRSVDIYGVVKFFKPPYMTSGADYCMVITIVDPSIDAQMAGLKCVIFNSDVNAMPKVLDVGDIVRFHRLKVITYRDELQGQKSPGFSCLVFDGTREAPIEARSTSSNYSLTELDKEKVKELRKWSKEGGFLCERLKRTLSNVTLGEHFDLICQVIATAASPQPDCFNLKVWDGTKYQLSLLGVDTYQLDEARQAEVDRIGSLAVDIFVNGQHVQFAKSLSPGDFVRFYNIHPSRGGGGLQGDVNIGSKVSFVLHDGTSYGRGIINLSKTNVEVRLLMRKLETAVEDALLAEAEDEAVCAEINDAEPSVQVDDAPDLMTLSKVKVGQYFDLTCQVIKTVEMSDASCVCINIWDGTKMNLPCRKMDCDNYSVSMIPRLADSAGSMAEDVCLYDNHMENGLKIKPGNFVKVTNLHASRYPPIRKEASLPPPPTGTAMKVELALHKGETFGKNVQILSPDSPLVVPLKRRLDVLSGRIPQVRAVSSDGGNAGTANVSDHRLKDSTTVTQGDIDVSASGTGDNDDDSANRKEKTHTSSETPRCMQRFASFTVNCERIKFLPISEAKDIPLPNKFRIRAKLDSFVPTDVRDFVHVHCSACNHRCGLSFLKASNVQGNQPHDGETESRRRCSPRLRKPGPSNKVGSEAEVSTSAAGQRSSMRIRVQLKSMGKQPTVRSKKNEVNYQEADSSQESNPPKSGKRKQLEDLQSTPPSPTKSPKRAKRDEVLSDSQSSNDYETASQGSCISSLPEVQRRHQRLKVLTVQGKHGTVEVENVSVNDIITLCKNGLKLSQPPRACLKYISPSSQESGVRLLCPRCSADSSNGPKILMNYEYLFKLNLSDDTGSLEVILQGDQATKFLNGMEPENLYQNDSQRNKLARIMEVICSSTGSDPTADTSHHPRLECCIKGHTIFRHEEVYRVYQLMDTLLADDVTDV